MSDLQTIRDILDRSEISHTVQYVGTGAIGGRGNVALHMEIPNHEQFNLVIEFEPDGTFVMFDLEETEQ